MQWKFSVVNVLVTQRPLRVRGDNVSVEGNYISNVLKPRLAVIDGKVTTTSMALAGAFGKQHFHVMRDIEKALAEVPKKQRESNFGFTSRDVPGPNGGVRKEPYYRLSRDGFAFVAMRFTGKRAAQWQWTYIEAFNRMEQSLLGLERHRFENRPSAPVRHDGMDSPLFSELLRALGKKIAQAALMTYLFEQGAHERPVRRSIRAISNDLSHNLRRSGLAKAAHLLSERGLNDYALVDNTSAFYINLAEVQELLQSQGLDIDVLLEADPNFVPLPSTAVH
jgi:Rha family phage regulatory protein